MSDENNALEQGGGEAVAATQPKNDAEAATQEQAATQESEKAKEAEAKKADEEATKRKNRTGQYIDRLKNDANMARNENAELRKRLDAIESRFPKQEAKPPTMETAGYDPEELARQTARYEVQQARQQWEEQQKSESAARSEQEKVQAYAHRAQAFASQNPDFEEVVGSIPQQFLIPELQKAVMVHERGPEIAYRLAQNEDELFQLATTRPELIDWAVARFASRLDAAPPQQEAEPAPPAFAPTPTNKPISQAPAPAPRVSGRAPTETPPEKLTDDDWYRRDREQRRKR
ncbi:hypothetical protein ACFQ6N_40240 [Kitasatospora sp. NPDC056446]|uniref:hypothetical protein n=1 Tax=Kitasatospora sp. NPDC056446 TaxID=3345819 RepID=UPI0036264158